ncbi:hypothetical protein Hanom_Chr10g00903051 [Helianthus anomalus]
MMYYNVNKMGSSRATGTQTKGLARGSVTPMPSSISTLARFPFSPAFHSKH